MHEFEEFFRWLDEVRWSDKNYIRKERYRLKFGSKKRILCFWLTYITDRRKSVEQVWGVNFDFNLKLIEKINKSPNKDFEEIFENLKKNFDLSSLPEDIKSILVTLEILRDPSCEKNKLWDTDDEIFNSFFNFFSRVLEKAKKQSIINPIDYICFSFFILSYFGASKKKEIEIIRNKRITILGQILSEEFNFTQERIFKKFLKDKNKRIWASIRDFKRNKWFLKLFAQYLDSNLLEWWESLPEIDLRLPGDSWNNKFIKKFHKYIDKMAERKEFWDSSLSFLKNFCIKHIAAPDMCIYCPISENKDITLIKDFCLAIKEDKSEQIEKICPYLTLITGSLLKCDLDNCLIFKRYLAIDNNQWLLICDNNL